MVLKERTSPIKFNILSFMWVGETMPNLLFLYGEILSLKHTCFDLGL